MSGTPQSWNLAHYVTRWCEAASRARYLNLHLPGLQVREELLKARGISSFRFPKGDGLFSHCNRFLLLAHRDIQADYCPQILKSLVHLDRLLDPGHGVFKLVVIEISV